MAATATVQNNQESYEFYFSDVVKKNLLQYDYRTNDGRLFSCVAKDLVTARAKRDNWLKSN